MATNFPTSLDGLTNPNPTSELDDAIVPHAQQHQDINDAMEAVQAKLGIDNSAVTTSIDFILKNITSGHNHDGVNSRLISLSGSIAAQRLLVLLAYGGPFEEYLSGMCRVVSDPGPFPSAITWYTDSSFTNKIVQKQYFRNSNKTVNHISYSVYDGSGGLLKTAVDSITYISGVFEEKRVRNIF